MFIVSGWQRASCRSRHLTNPRPHCENQSSSFPDATSTLHRAAATCEGTRQAALGFDVQSRLKASFNFALLSMATAAGLGELGPVLLRPAWSATRATRVCLRCRRNFATSPILQSGHNKWSTIRHHKGKKDQIKSAVRMQYVEAITLYSRSKHRDAALHAEPRADHRAQCTVRMSRPTPLSPMPSPLQRRVQCPKMSLNRPLPEARAVP